VSLAQFLEVVMGGISSEIALDRLNHTFVVVHFWVLIWTNLIQGGMEVASEFQAKFALAEMGMNGIAV